MRTAGLRSSPAAQLLAPKLEKLLQQHVQSMDGVKAANVAWACGKLQLKLRASIARELAGKLVAGSSELPAAKAVLVLYAAAHGVLSLGKTDVV